MSSSSKASTCFRPGYRSPPRGTWSSSPTTVDFSIYVDAQESHIKEWYLERFLRLREEALEDSTAYFHRFAELSVEQAKDVAMRVWDEIDHPNLKENIEPTKDRARLILEKDQDHSVKSVRLRKI